MATELDRVRRTKETLRQRLSGDPRCVGIGITEVDGHLAVKVNWREGPCNDQPTSVNGVRVVHDVVGRIRKQGA